MRVLHAGHIAPDPAWGMVEHQHRFHETIVVLGGRSMSTGQAIVAQRGDVLLYPAGVPHREQSDADQPCETRYGGRVIVPAWASWATIRRVVCEP